MPRLVRLAVTTPLRPDPLEVEAARGAAERHGLPYVARDGRGLSRVVAEVGAEAALVLSAGRAVLSSGGAEHAWSPGMGALRLRRYLDARAGRAADPTARDPFLDAAGIEPGDAVLDCTAGLGADALVAAAAAGPRGLVLALESSRALAAWTGEGLRRFPAEAARRVEVRCADHLEHLTWSSSTPCSARPAPSPAASRWCAASPTRGRCPQRRWPRPGGWRAASWW